MSNTSEKQKEFSKKVKDRMIELIDKNEIFFSHELNIFQSIANKYNMMSIAEFAKYSNCAYNTVVAEIKSGKIPVLKVQDKFFILEKLI